MLIPILAIAAVFGLIFLISLLFIKLGAGGAEKANITYSSRFIKGFRDGIEQFKSTPSEETTEDNRTR